MSLSIMHLLIASCSQFAAHPHHHQRQVRRPHQQSLCVARRAQARACLSTGTPCDRCFSDLGHACTRGGGGSTGQLRNMVPRGCLRYGCGLAFMASSFRCSFYATHCARCSDIVLSAPALQDLVSPSDTPPRASLPVSSCHSQLVVSGTDVSYISATEVACLQPVLDSPFLAPSYIEVSLDGQVYSKTLAAYAIVGRGVALLVPPESSIPSLPAADATHLPDIDVCVVDVSKYCTSASAAPDSCPSTFAMCLGMCVHICAYVCAFMCV